VGIVDYRGVGSETIVSTPGVVIKSRARLSSRARDRAFSSFWHRSKSVLRAASSASEIVDSVGWPAPQTAQAGLGDTADVDAGLHIRSRLHSPPPATQK
jgi:hypothetical protein